eukprot:3742251-Pleurochrysis_carterae.AAC.1
MARGRGRHESVRCGAVSAQPDLTRRLPAQLRAYICIQALSREWCATSYYDIWKITAAPTANGMLA